MEHMDGPKKRARGGQGPDTGPVRPTQVLSPTSSNSRLNNRDRPASPTKSQIARPTSPLKGNGTSRYIGATNVLSSMVEKAKASRNAGARKVTTASNASSSSAATTAPTKARARAAPASKTTASRPPTRTGRRVSDNSETSEGSATTVLRQAGVKKAAAPTTKKTMMGTIRKGVASGAKKAVAAKAAVPAQTSSSGRVLRKRG